MSEYMNILLEERMEERMEENMGTLTHMLSEIQFQISMKIQPKGEVVREHGKGNNYGLFFNNHDNCSVWLHHFYNLYGL